MSTQQSFLVCDSSTLTNFKQWAQAISGFFATAGTWTQSSDTGQVNWSTISSPPGSGAFVYEIWQPNDGLTNFYLKMEYGNFSGTNSPTVRVSIGTSTNGAGTLTGFVLGPMTTFNGVVAPSSSAQYECDFSGAAGRIGAIMWRTGINACQESWAVERSVNSSGTYTGSHVTLIYCGGGTGRSVMGTLVFGVGVAPFLQNNTNGAGLNARLPYGGGASTAFNGGIGFDTTAPYIGYFDYPLTMIGIANGVDIVEGVTFTTTVYGATRTYMPTKIGNLSAGATPLQTNISWGAWCMRYD